jgi:hypothetical protein
MSMHQAPPGRISIWHVGLVESSTPHQSSTNFGSVHIRKTRWRDASKDRVSVKSDGCVVADLKLEVIELSCLHLIEHLFDPIKAAFPQAAISLEPIANFD